MRTFSRSARYVPFRYVMSSGNPYAYSTHLHFLVCLCPVLTSDDVDQENIKQCACIACPYHYHSQLLCKHFNCLCFEWSNSVTRTSVNFQLCCIVADLLLFTYNDKRVWIAMLWIVKSVAELLYFQFAHLKCLPNQQLCFVFLCDDTIKMTESRLRVRTKSVSQCQWASAWSESRAIFSEFTFTRHSPRSLSFAESLLNFYFL